MDVDDAVELSAWSAGTRSTAGTGPPTLLKHVDRARYDHSSDVASITSSAGVNGERLVPDKRFSVTSAHRVPEAERLALPDVARSI